MEPTELVRTYDGADIEIPEAGTFKIDKSHGAVEFVARHS